MVIRRTLGPRKIVVVWNLLVWVISKIVGHLWLSLGFFTMQQRSSLALCMLFQTFRSFMERLGMESKSLLCLDIPTRWNSTYLMFETAKNFEKVSLEWTLKMIVIRHTLGPRKIVVVWNLLVWVISKIVGHLWLSWGFFTMQQRSSLALYMLFQMPFSMRYLLFRGVFLI